MFRFDAEKSVHFCDGLRRRDFLHAGSLAFLGLTLRDFEVLKAAGAVQTSRDVNCILLMLVGGPSQLDTWDMKPDAPSEIRGPYSAIPTNVAGIQISEIFPRMAKHADKYALLRSVYHSGAGVHDVGHQYMQTGRFFQFGDEQPHFGCVVSKLKGPKGDAPPHVLLPRPIGNTGGNLPHGQSAGFLGKTYDPFVLNADPSEPDFAVRDLLSPDYLPPIRVDGRASMRKLVDRAVSHLESVPDARLLDSNFHSAYRLMSSESARAAFNLAEEDDKTKDRYGRNRFGMSCLLARRMIERGVRFVTVNMFETVFNEITWDIHGSAPFSPISCYRDLVGPMFDHAYSSLLEDLHDRRLLQDTLVLAAGEFGRTPKVNPAGGRDHWTNCWTMLMAGGGIKGGQVVGSSDEIGALSPRSPDRAARRRRHRLQGARHRHRDAADGCSQSSDPDRRLRAPPDCGAVLTGFSGSRRSRVRRFAGSDAKFSMMLTPRALISSALALFVAVCGAATAPRATAAGSGRRAGDPARANGASRARARGSSCSSSGAPTAASSDRIRRRHLLVLQSSRGHGGRVRRCHRRG